MQLNTSGPSSLIRYMFYIGTVGVVTLGYWLLYQQPLLGIDDTCIYFTYVKNFAEGYGFVYNPGGERVEGFTSTLWLLVLIGLNALSADNFTILALILNSVLVGSTLYVCSNFIQKQADASVLLSKAEIVFLSFLVLTPGYIDWTIVTLMETGLWSCMVITVTLMLMNDTIRQRRGYVVFTLLLCLLIILRPESLLLVMVFVGLAFLRISGEKASMVAGIKGVLIMLLAVVGMVAGHTMFRVLYFGYPLPNTYYAKVSSDTLYNLYHGLRYVAFSLLQTPMLIILIGGVALSAWLLIRKYISWVIENRSLWIPFSPVDWPQFVLVIVSAVSLIIPVYVGGDHFKLLRFFQPFFPLYFLVVFNVAFWKAHTGFSVDITAPGRWIALATVIAFSYLCTASPLHTFRKGASPIDWEFRLAEIGAHEGDQMNKLFAALESLPSVGVSAAGGFAYAYNGEVVDLMGLNNTRMAHATTLKIGIKNHAAFDKDVFFEQHPDVFHGYAKISSFVKDFEQDSLLENTPAFEEAFVSRMYKQVFRDPRFLSQYKPVIVSDPEETIILKTYMRTGFVDLLRRKGYRVKELSRNFQNTASH